MITLYKRNAQGKPLFWSICPHGIIANNILIKYGLVDKHGRT